MGLKTAGSRHLFVIAFFLALLGFCNYKLIDIYKQYHANVEKINEIDLAAVDKMYSQPTPPTEQQVRQLVSIASERKLEIAFIYPLFTLNLLSVNALILMICFLTCRATKLHMKGGLPLGN